MAVAKKKTARKKTVKKAAAPKKKATAEKTPGKKKVVTKKVVKKKSATGKAVKSVSKTATSKKKSVATKPRNSVLEISAFTPYKEKKGEEYMNPRQKEHFLSLLKNWKQDLLTDMERTVHHMQDEAANFPDPNDRATQESEFSLELRTRDRERKLIKKIDESSLQLENNEYGYCEVCGIEIGIRRLEARPTATLCIDCKTLDEIREKQSRG